MNIAKEKLINSLFINIVSTMYNFIKNESSIHPDLNNISFFGDFSRNQVYFNESIMPMWKQII